jgi:hypothetical protein
MGTVEDDNRLLTLISQNNCTCGWTSSLFREEPLASRNCEKHERNARQSGLPKVKLSARLTLRASREHYLKWHILNIMLNQNTDIRIVSNHLHVASNYFSFA